jgi:hypothetical protein
MSSTFAGPNDKMPTRLREGESFVIMDPFTEHERMATAEEHAAITAYWVKQRPLKAIRIDPATKTVTFG